MSSGKLMGSARPLTKHEDAPVAVRRQRKGSLRRNWLSGAFVFGLMGLIGYAGVHMYETQHKIEQAGQARGEVEAQLKEAKLRKQTLETNMSKVTDDAHMEMSAKALGFVYPNETVFQKGNSKPPQ